MAWGRGMAGGHGGSREEGWRFWWGTRGWHHRGGRHGRARHGRRANISLGMGPGRGLSSRRAGTRLRPQLSDLVVLALHLQLGRLEHAGQVAHQGGLLLGKRVPLQSRSTPSMYVTVSTQSPGTDGIRRNTRAQVLDDSDVPFLMPASSQMVQDFMKMNPSRPIMQEAGQLKCKRPMSSA